MYASVDLGGTKIAAAVGTAEGSIRAQAAAPTRSHEGPEAVIERTAALVNGLAREVGQRPVALGLGVPGLTDIEAGTTRFLPNLTGGWRDVSVRSLLAAAIGCPVSVLNDSRMATLGELTYGRGRTARTFIYLSLGTGIGGGVVVEGRLQLGPLGAAGELGHQTILPDGPHCTCGNRGCLETLASGPALTARGIFLLQCGRAPILRDLVKGDLSRVTPREMADAAAHGEATVRAEIVRVAEYIGIGVANAVTMLHPDLVVLGGGVSDIGALLVDTVRETVRDRVRMFPADTVRIERTTLNSRAGLLGGLALARTLAADGVRQ